RLADGLRLSGSRPRPPPPGARRRGSGRRRAPRGAPRRLGEPRVRARGRLVGARGHGRPGRGGGGAPRPRDPGARGSRPAARGRARARRLAIDPRGRVPAPSHAFAAWLGRRLEAPGPTALLVGGAAGLPPALAAGADERLSLGPLTLPHQLARVVLAEPLYRA